MKKYKLNKIATSILFTTSTLAMSQGIAFADTTSCSQNASGQTCTFKDTSNVTMPSDTSGNDDITLDNAYLPSGVKTLATGDGNDSLIIKNYNAQDITTSATFDGGNGNDTIVFSNMTPDATGESNLYGTLFTGNNGNDNITVQDNQNLKNVKIHGDAGNDTLNLINNDNISNVSVIGGSGNDTILVKNTTCTSNCYLDGEDGFKSTGGNNSLNLDNSDVDIIYKNYDTKNTNYNTSGLHNFTEVDVDNNSHLDINGENNTVSGNATVSNIGNITVNNNSSLTLSGSATDILEDTSVNLSTDSHLTVDGDIAAGSTENITFSTFSTDNAAGSVTYTPTNANAGDMQVTFSNGKQSVIAQSGAYNYDANITTITDAGTETSTVSQQKMGLGSDVQAALAGLDAAKQTSNFIARNISSHIDNVNNNILLHGEKEGNNVWGNFLYQNGNVQSDVNYKNVLEGVQGGLDWTNKLSNDSNLTLGFALAYIRNKINSDDYNVNYKNTLSGNYSSLYASWQQSLQDNFWGLFADSSFSYGDLNYSLSGKGYGSDTTGNLHSYDAFTTGDSYNTTTRLGVNFMLRGKTILQPYTIVGWNKSSAKDFSDDNINFGNNYISIWDVGAGLRASTEVDLAKLTISPWVDASYISEFNNSSDFSAADYHLTDGDTMSLGMFGVGLSTNVTPNVNFNTSVWYNTGDMDNDVSLYAGINCRF